MVAQSQALDMASGAVQQRRRQFVSGAHLSILLGFLQCCLVLCPCFVDLFNIWGPVNFPELHGPLADIFQCGRHLPLPLAIDQPLCKVDASLQSGACSQTAAFSTAVQGNGGCTTIVHTDVHYAWPISCVSLHYATAGRMVWWLVLVHPKSPYLWFVARHGGLCGFGCYHLRPNRAWAWHGTTGTAVLQ